jgi:hypothetical protein
MCSLPLRSLTVALAVNTDLPLNLDDTDLGTELALIGKPPSIMTNTSFLIFIIEMASLQRRMADEMVGRELNYEKVLEIDRYALFAHRLEYISSDLNYLFSAVLFEIVSTE